MTEIYPEDIELVKKQLERYTFPVEDRLAPQDIVVKTLEQVLKTGITDGPSMKAIEYLFHSILSSEHDGIVPNSGIYRLKKEVNIWLGDITEIAQGETSLVYKASVINKNIEVVVKVPKNDTFTEENVLREYLVGLTLNKLRYQIPNFVYTLGAFSCSKLMTENTNKICVPNKDFTTYILYEKINGMTLTQGIYNGKVTPSDCIAIFALILLALEVAQRECRFTHYDLNPENVMLVENMPNYEVVLDDIVYKIVKPKYVPILLDFGFSSVRTDGGTTGVSIEPYYNKYMIPGHDMYFFIYKILNLYRVLKIQDKDLGLLLAILREHRQGKYLIDKLNISSHVIDVVNPGQMLDTENRLRYLLTNIPGISETPIQLFKNLCKYRARILSDKIVPLKRDKLYSLRYTSSIKTYYDILGSPREGSKRALYELRSCIKNDASFILLKYQLYILEKYNQNLKSRSLDDLIVNNRRKLVTRNIGFDIAGLNGVFTVKVPNFDWKDLIHTITSVMPYTATIPAKKSVIKYMKPLTDYISSVKPYFDMYYTILELGLEKERKSTYGEWVRNFTSSENFTFYTENIDFITEGIRWSQTLSDSMNVNIEVENDRKIIVNFADAKFWDFLFEKSDGSEILIKDEALVNQ